MNEYCVKAKLFIWYLWLQVGVIRDVYIRIQGAGVDQSSFFALRGWDYERSPARRKAEASTVGPEAVESTEGVSKN